MYVGNILIPYVNELSSKNVSKDLKINKMIESGLSLHSEDINSRPFTMGGVICDFEGRGVESFADDINAIGSRSAKYNKISYENNEGFLSVEGSEVPLTAEAMNARPFSFTGQFFPSSKFQDAYQVELDYIANDYNIKFPPIIALPVEAYDVRIKSAWDTILLNPYGVINGIDGDLNLYRPYPIFDELNYNGVETTGEQIYLEEAHGCLTLNLNAQNEKAEWQTGVGVELPKGIYKFVCRIRDDNVADDIKITVIDSSLSNIISETFSTGGTDWVSIDTGAFQLYNNETVTIRIEKVTATANNIEIDYGFMSPETVNTIVYDSDKFVDKGEIKVFDAQGNEESEWQQIFDENHVFNDDSVLIIQNSLFRWKIDLMQKWGDTGEITGLKNNETGHLYPIAFANNKIIFKIKSLLPDTCEIFFYMSNGDSAYGADTAKEIARVRIRPHDFVFELKRYGEFSGDWIIDWSEVTNFIGSYCADSQFVSTTSADLNYTSKNGNYITIFDDTLFVFCKSIKEDSVIKNNGGYITLANSSSSDYMFSIAAISDFRGAEYLFKSDDLVINVPENLEFETLVTEYDSTMFSHNLGESYYNWDGNSLHVFADTQDQRFGKVLKSYDYRDINYAKVDFKFNDIAYLITGCALIFGYKDDKNYYYAEVLYLQGAESLKINRYIDGVYSSLASVSITNNLSAYNTLDVEVSGNTITAYIYEQGTSRNNGTSVSYTDATTTKEGNVGIFAANNVGGKLDKNFQNFKISGENIRHRSVLVNTIYDDLNWNTKNEYILNEGSLTKWSHDNTDLTFDCVSSDSQLETITLDNVILNSGNYKCDVNIKSEDAITREAGFIFASQDGQSGLYYSLVLAFDSLGNPYLALKKYGAAALTEGTYGIGGCAEYGYGSVGAEVTLNASIPYVLPTIHTNEWVTIECDYDHINSTFMCYCYRKGDTKPPPVMSYVGDNYYTVGNVGLIAKSDAIGLRYIDASFKNLEVTNTNEDGATNGNFISMGGVPHGARYNEVEDAHIFNTQLTALEYAKYNLFIRTKVNEGVTSLGDLYFENQTDSETLSIEKPALFETVVANNAWVVQNEILNIDNTHNGKIGYIGIKRTNETVHDKPIFLIDFMSLMPINGNLDSNYAFPYDVAFETYNDINYIGKIVKREFETNIIDRIDADYFDINYADM